MSKKQNKKHKSKNSLQKDKIKQLKNAKFEKKIKEIRYAFQSKKSLDIGEDEEIISKIDQVLNEIDGMNQEDLRQSIANFSYELNQVGESVIPYFILLFSQKLEVLKSIKKYDESHLDEKIDDAKYMSLVKDAMIKSTGRNFRLKNYKLPKMTPSEEKVLYCTSRKVLDHYSLEKVDESNAVGDLTARVFSFAINRVLAKKHSCSYEFYYQFTSFLQRLNRDGYGQQARDFAEEALACAVADGNISFGHYCKYSLYVDQKNILDSLLHSSMLLVNSIKKDEVNTKLLKGTLFSAFKFYRESGLYPLALDIHKYMSENFKLSDFEKQQIDTAKLYLVLVSEGVKVVESAEKYIKENKDIIIDWKESSQMPWLSLLSNIECHFPVEYSKSKELSDFYALMKIDMPASAIEELDLKFGINNADSKSYLKDSLKKLSLTRNQQDYISEIEQLSFTSGALLDVAIEQKDVEGILLAHQIRSDGGIDFKSIELKGSNNIIPLSFNESASSKCWIDNYLEHIEASLAHYKDKQFVWLGFDNSGKAYCVVYKGNKLNFCGYLDSIKVSSINNWLTSELENIRFNDSPKTSGLFETQEDIWGAESQNIQDNLLRVCLPVEPSEVIIFSDLDFSPYPHNLITNKDGTIISGYSPVSAPLSLKNFIKNDNNEIIVNRVSVWGPICEQDFPVNIAYSKLQDELKSHEVDFSEGIIPDISALNNINAFISHGGRDDLNGFKGLYPTDGKAYLNYRKIFGTGDIALLFICHSGSLVKNNFTKSSHSLIKELLANGYKTVVAPSWSIHPCILGIWTNDFLDNMKAGKTVSTATFLANQRVRETYNTESAWANMHVFGNPELVNAIQVT